MLVTAINMHVYYRIVLRFTARQGRKPPDLWALVRHYLCLNMPPESAIMLLLPNLHEHAILQLETPPTARPRNKIRRFDRKAPGTAVVVSRRMRSGVCPPGSLMPPPALASERFICMTDEDFVDEKADEWFSLACKLDKTCFYAFACVNATSTILLFGIFPNFLA